jgi:DNA polymerase III delta prime subunit
LEKLNIIIEKWIKIGDSNSQTESIRLIKNLEQKLKELSINDTEKIVLNVKAKILSEKNINAEKIKLRKKIEDFQKKISQLENNLNFIKGDSNNEILSNVHSDINNYKNELKKLKKDFKIISKT